MDNSFAAPKIAPTFKPVQMASYGDDSAVMARFDDDMVKNEYRSSTEGRVVYDHMIRVDLEYPGNNLSTYSYRFSPEEGQKGNQWTQRFPRQWQAFLDQKEQVPDGTPIEMWPPLDKKRVFEMKAMKIFTVEQVAALTDTTGPNMGLEWRKMRDMAIAYLKPEVGQAALAKLTREKEDQETRIRVLEAQLSQLANSTSVPLEDPPKRRGRKPRTEETQAA